MGAEAARDSFCALDVGLIDEARALVKGRLREGLKGSTATTFGIGGPIRAVVTVDDAQELAAVRSLLWSAQQPVRNIGNGSNLLIADAGLDAWVIRLGAGFRGVEPLGGGALRVGGAASLMNVARRVSDEGLSGLEFAAGIPATFGGALFMNAGAHGAEIGERVVEVTGVMPDGAVKVWTHRDLPWRYRSSGLPAGVTVTSAVLQLCEGDRASIAELCAACLAERRARQPLALPSAGSVFKNPSPDLPAGRVIEEAGLKGARIGGAVVSELHANWIVNPNKEASAADVAALIAMCIERVKARSGITLEPEVKIWV